MLRHSSVVDTHYSVICTLSGPWFFVSGMQSEYVKRQEDRIKLVDANGAYIVQVGTSTLDRILTACPVDSRLSEFYRRRHGRPSSPPPARPTLPNDPCIDEACPPPNTIVRDHAKVPFSETNPIGETRYVEDYLDRCRPTKLRHRTAWDMKPLAGVPKECLMTRE